jgi:hypothetical protein
MANKLGILIRVVIIGAVVGVAACGSDASQGVPSPTPTTAADAPAATATPTPTPVPVDAEPPTPTPIPSRCQGLSGSLEVRVLVGPADAVGMEPVAIGSVPFSVVTDEEPYILEGGGAIAYDEVLVKEWGTYEVTMDLNVTIGGVCEGGADAAELAMEIETTGDQLVVVTAEGFQGEYPWSGTHTFQQRFPAEEGATAAGEGWEFVLHLDG